MIQNLGKKMLGQKSFVKKYNSNKIFSIFDTLKTHLFHYIIYGGDIMKTLFSSIAMAILIVGTLILSSCNQTTEPSTGTATQLSLSDLYNSAGYSWFEAEKTLYAPDDSKIRDIAAEFKNKNQMIYFFVNPSCSCNGTKKTFPHAIRILKDAGVPDANIVIYSMKSFTDNHPLKDKFTLRGLPSIFITVNGNAKYSMEVIDDVLYVSGGNKKDDKPSEVLESILLEGFKF